MGFFAKKHVVYTNRHGLTCQDLRGWWLPSRATCDWVSYLCRRRAAISYKKNKRLASASRKHNVEIISIAVKRRKTDYLGPRILWNPDDRSRDCVKYFTFENITICSIYSCICLSPNINNYTQYLTLSFDTPQSSTGYCLPMNLLRSPEQCTKFLSLFMEIVSGES